MSISLNQTNNSYQKQIDLYNTDNVNNRQINNNAADGQSVPDIAQKMAFLLEDPKLERPQGNLGEESFVNLGALSTEAIMSMLGFEERKDAVESGTSAIETKRQQRAEINEERIANLKEQADKAEKSGFLDKLKQAFSYIGMALGAIASIAAIVAGGMSGNPLLIAGGVLMLLSTTEQIMSAASGGELSLANGFAQAAKATGGDEQAARIAGMVCAMAIGVAGAIMTGGAGASGAASQAASMTTKVTNTISSVTGVISGVNQVASGSVSIAKGVYDYQIANLKADMSDLQAILLRIQQASDLDTEQLKKIMEKSQDMAQGVKEVLDDCNQSLGTVLTGAPAMA